MNPPRATSADADADPSPDAISFHTPRWQLGCAVLLVTFAIGFAAIFLSLFIGQPVSQWSGKMWVLVVLSPVCLILVLGCLWFGVVWFGRCLTRYDVTPDELGIRKLFRRRHIAWSDVNDFALHAAAFPEAPKAMTLLVSNGPPVYISIQSSKSEQVKRLLEAYVPGLAAHGIGRVKSVRGVRDATSDQGGIGRVGSLFAVIGCLVIFAFCALAGYAVSVKYINYWRITSNPVEVEAVIVEIDRDGSGDDVDVDATVRYTAADGTEVTLRRDVPERFDQQFDVGDTVIVEHLAGDPSVGRIRDWDLDARQWIMLLLVLPFGWASLLGLVGGIYGLTAPPSRTGDWTAVHITGEDYWGVKCSTYELETNAAVWPDRHRGGAAVIMRLQGGSQKNDDSRFDPTQRHFEKAGIPAKLVADTFLVIGGDPFSRVLDRLGREPTVKADYTLLNVDSAEEAERWALERTAKKTPVPDEPADLSETRYFCAEGVQGPFGREELSAGFNRWIKLELERLFGGEPPDGLLDVDFSELLRYPDRELMMSVLLQRRRQTAHIYCRHTDEDHALFARFDRGRWSVLPNVPAPVSMRTRRWLFGGVGLISIIAFGPLLLIVMFARMLVWPITYATERHRRKKLREAQDAMLGRQTSDDAPPT